MNGSRLLAGLVVVAASFGVLMLRAPEAAATVGRLAVGAVACVIGLVGVSVLFDGKTKVLGFLAVTVFGFAHLVTVVPTVAAAMSPPTPSGGPCAGDVDRVLATIRQKESGGDYTAVNPLGAYGAYQFVTDTWDHEAAEMGRTDLVGRLPSTVSPADQDAVARHHVEQWIGQGAEAVPVGWYVGEVYSAGDPRWDQIPARGNTRTVRQYQQEWLAVYRTTAGACPTVAPPLPAGAYTGTPDVHHDYPAVDLAVPEGTPVYAVVGGEVRYVGGDCGTGVAVTGADEWIYCHGSRRTVEEGATVNPGDQIMESGNTGFSTGPHLHIQERKGGAGGPLVCPVAPVDPLDRLPCGSPA